MAVPPTIVRWKRWAYVILNFTLHKKLWKLHHDYHIDICLLHLSNCWKFQRFNHFQLWEDSSEHLDFKIPLHSISLPYYGIIWMNNRLKPNCWFMGHTVYSTLGCLSWVPFHFSFLFFFFVSFKSHILELCRIMIRYNMISIFCS